MTDCIRVRLTLYVFMLMSHTATSPVALPAGPSIPAVVSCAVRMGGAIVQPLGKHSGGAMPHPHSWATGVSWTSSTVSVYPPDYNVDNRAASTLDIGCHTPPSSGRTSTDQSCSSPCISTRRSPSVPSVLMMRVTKAILSSPRTSSSSFSPSRSLTPMLLELTPCPGPLQDLAGTAIGLRT